MKMKTKIGNIALVIMVLSLVVAIGQSQSKELDQSNPIKIGYLMPATVTNMDMRGLQMAVEEINNSGGVLGRPLKIIFRDDKFNSDVAIREVKDLVFNEKVFWLQGVISSSVSHAVSEFARENKIIFINTVATSDKLMNEWGHRYVFRMQSNSYSQAVGAAEAAVKLYGPRKSLYNISPDYEGGHAAWENFLKRYQQLVPDAKVVGAVFPKLGNQEYTPYLTAIMNSSADLIFSAFYIQDAQTLIKQSEGLGLNGKIPVVGLWWSTNDLAQNFNANFYPKKSIGGTAYAFWEINYPKNKIFYTKFKNKFGTYPYLDFASYSITHEMARLINKVKKLDTEKIIDLLEGDKIDTPLGIVEMRKCDHQAMLPFWYGEIGPLPGFQFYAARNNIKVGSETYHSCEEALKLRQK